MFPKILLINLIAFYLLVGQEVACSEDYDLDIISQDIFGALEIDTDELSTGTIQQLNDLLIKRAASADPVANLDVIIEELIKDYKNKVSLDEEFFQAKRLVAALSTINDDNQCGPYSFRILQACLDGIDSSVRGIVRDEYLRRIDKILAHYIRKHVNDCRDVYFKKFSRISEQLDETKVRYLNTFLEKAIENLVNNNDIEGETRVERLYNVGKHELSSSFDLMPKYIYETLKELARGDPNERYLTPVEDEHSGLYLIKRDKFDHLIRKYFLQPCEYFKQQFKKDVFDPFRFDSMFDKHVQSDAVDFYEGWLKLRFCSFSIPTTELIRNVVNVIEPKFRQIKFRQVS